MTQRPAVRLVALSIFAILNVALCWLWWRVVQVEKHSLPDLCLFPDISCLFFAQHEAASEQTRQTSPGAIAPLATKLGSCAISQSALLQRQIWRRRLTKDSLDNTVLCTGSGDSAPVEELLQWTTHLDVVPLCAEAEPAAQLIYRQLSAIGDADASDHVIDGQCIAVPFLAILNAAGRGTASPSGSYNGLLAVRLVSPGPSLGKCIRLDDRGTAPIFDEGAVAQASPGDHQALVTLQLYVSSSLGNVEDIRLHIGSGSSMLLIVTQQSDAPGKTIVNEAAAEAVIQALGRWVLSPATLFTSADAEWRLRFWLLGDGDDEGTARDSRQSTAAQIDAASGSPESQEIAQEILPTDSSPWTYLKGFFEALSSLIDVSFTSQVVPHSGLQEIDWEHLVHLASSAPQTAEKGSIMENAALEETQKRIGSLLEAWDTDQEHYRSSRILNLSLYKPISSNVAPAGFSLALPSWGFLTVGSSLDSGAMNRREGKSGTPHFAVDTKELLAISSVWTAQLRSLIGLNPALRLTSRESVACGSDFQVGICGRECKSQRCSWHVEETALPNNGEASEGLQAPVIASGSGDFLLAPTKTVLRSTSSASPRRVSVYLHPSRRGVADWEIWGLAADVHFSLVTQAAGNIRTLRETLSNHLDVRIPEHIGIATQHVMQALHCSVEALRMRSCAFLPEAALELLKQQGTETCDTTVAGECASRTNGFKDAKAAVYAQLALLFARSAFKDSKELLVDGSVESAPFFSRHFNLAIHVPLLLPFVLPTIASIIRATRAALKKRP